MPKKSLDVGDAESVHSLNFDAPTKFSGIPVFLYHKYYRVISILKLFS